MLLVDDERDVRDATATLLRQRSIGRRLAPAVLTILNCGVLDLLDRNKKKPAADVADSVFLIQNRWYFCWYEYSRDLQKSLENSAMRRGY